MVRPGADCPASSRVPVLSVVGCAVLLAVAACGRSSDMNAARTHEPSTSWTLMQMNLCLSGLAGCYLKAAYPAVVEEAVARIREARPDAITFSEACRTDVARIARRT